MQNEKYQSSASFVFRAAGAHRRVVHTLRLVEKPFNKNEGGESAGGGGVWINQIHVTTMALDSSGLLFF